MLTQKEKIRYARHLALPNFEEKDQLKLKKARILIVGAGGLGCPIIQYLAAVGVGMLGIIDQDSIELSNLQRQILYKEEQLNNSKVDAASDYIKALNNNIITNIYYQKLDSTNALTIFKNYDLVIDGTDNFPTRYLINDACVILGLPFIYGAIHRFEGQVAVFNYLLPSGRSANYRDIFPKPPEPNMIISCETGGVLGILPGIIGCYQANEAIKIIVNKGNILYNTLLIFDALAFTHHKFKIATKNSDPITQLIDYEEFCQLKTENNDEISHEEFKKCLKMNQPIIIDVRSQLEFDTYNIGGTCISLPNLEERLQTIDKTNFIVCICQSGGRSMKAVHILKKKRF